MKRWKNVSRRGLSMLLVLVMCVGMLQIPAFAEEGTPSESTPTVSESAPAPEGGGDEGGGETPSAPGTPGTPEPGDGQPSGGSEEGVTPPVTAGGDEKSEGENEGDTPPVTTEGDEKSEGEDEGDAPPVTTEGDEKSEDGEEGDKPPVTTEGDEKSEDGDEGNTPPVTGEGDEKSEGEEEGDTPPVTTEGDEKSEDEDEGDKPQVNVPSYATQAELDAAYEAVGNVDPTSDDMRAFIAAMDAYLAVYNRLSPEDQAARAEEMAYVQAYRDQIAAGQPDEDLETLAAKWHTVTLVPASTNSYSSKITSAKVRVGQTVNGYEVTSVSGTTIKVKAWGDLYGDFFLPRAADLWNGAVKSDYVIWAGTGNSNKTEGSSAMLPQSDASAYYYFNTAGSVEGGGSKSTLRIDTEVRVGNKVVYTKTGTAFDITVGTGYTPTDYKNTSGLDTTKYTLGSFVSAERTSGSGKFKITASSSTGTTTTDSQYRQFFVTDGTNVVKVIYSATEKQQAQKVTLTYMDRGGIYAGPTQYDKGATVTVIDCTNTRAGYEFKGWDTDSSADEVLHEVGDTFIINQNMTLYAVWKKIDTPTDDGKGISITKTRVSINDDESATTAEPGDTITWNITVTNNSNVTKNVTLTEQLTGAYFTETNARTQTVTLAAGETKTVTASYTVKGADKGTTIVNTVVGKTDNPDDGETEAKDDGTRVPDPSKVTVTYKDADGQAIPGYDPQTESKGTEFTIKDAPTPPDGKVFDKWQGDDGKDYQPGDKVTPDKDLTLTVVWKDAPETITVTWKDGYTNTPLKTETVNKPEYDPMTREEVEALGVAYPEDPVREDYYFDGWGSPEVDGAGNVTITAQWQPKIELKIEIVGNYATVPYNGQEQSVTGYVMTVKDKDGNEISLPDGLTVTPVSGDCAAKGTNAQDEKYPMGLKTDDFSVTGTNTGKYKVIFTVTDGWLKITPPETKLAVTAGDVTATYDGQGHRVTPVVTVDGVEVTDADVTIVYKDESGNVITGVPTDAGEYTAEITAVKDGKEAKTTTKVTITRRELTITTNSASKTYDGTALTAPGRISGLVDGETVTFTLTGSQTEVGSSRNGYTLTWDGTAKESNYTVTVGTIGTLTVNARTGGGGGDGGGRDPRPDPDPRPTPDPTPTEPDTPDEPPVVDITDPDVPLTDIPDTDVPLTDIPDEEIPLTETPEEVVELPDEDVPLDATPRTGDSSRASLWLLLCGLSLLGTVLLVKKREGETA